ncbi:uroporphyrin-III C-methyltransferase/precorrin-2 dehydrogenase/sirohydrochlorin ferrochelatase [Asanoa ferruginea]|uniref:Uroporphyrin-III C-methyltransferase/precorrin-2 dehydrogenase/sirohydrochlorin ferrochelatase n=1 Tax=Asanoa ferruginea TaxID=53367 RepID=A0A3D9ZD36_9ACTN|nr:uroporphyrinogen-III C-methyltransferase [Asanoa ferruginea]REF94414.1 uroporphyrin-III C-methyltransferase/precorrin-2 dehydrogenase/sirohydrochlorin ferrochelatase [Asanoa ferruginea]GIF53457.1 uroporphyrinogen-III C-methyltransferase [Asanoa ferruginea]
MTELYPLALRLDGRPVLVVGGGAVASRRVPALLSAGASVTVVSPELTPTLHGLADAGRLRWERRLFEPSDVDGVWLVHVAVDDPAAAQRVSDAAEARQVFCVRADDRTAATAWTPAVTRRGPVTVAVLGGGDPRRAVATRDAIAAFLSGWTGAAASGTAFAAGPAHAAAEKGGRVALVGAGPGDPELITVKGRRLLAEADVVVADRLAPGLLLDELRPDAELVDAAKNPYGPARTQDEINQILVDRARQGLLVVRLKGGDPFVFGRGGEEVIACAAAGVPVTVVPGVTSAVSVPASAGIPVTHRGVAHEFTVVSGHLSPDDPESLVNWPSVAQQSGTVVILMGLRHLPTIAATLVANGRPGSTPAAVIQEGTTAEERTVTGTLETIAAAVAEAGLRAPAITVVGEVVTALS